MGFVDRIIRLVVGIVLIILSFTNFQTGAVHVVLLVIAGVFIFTGLFGICPLYNLFGINTCSRPQKGSR